MRLFKKKALQKEVENKNKHHACWMESQDKKISLYIDLQKSLIKNLYRLMGIELATISNDQWASRSTKDELLRDGYDILDATKDYTIFTRPISPCSCETKQTEENKQGKKQCRNSAKSK